MATLAQAVDAVSNLTTTVDTKIQDIDSRVNEARHQLEQHVTEAQQQVDNFIAGARGEQSHFRLTKNQVLKGDSGSPPTGWRAHSSCSFELVETVSSGVEHSDRSALAQEFLETMYPSGVKHFYLNFNIWRMTWSDRPSHSMFQKHTATQMVTHMAICKLISGGIRGWWAEGAELGVCKITGRYYKSGDLGYTYNHPYPQTASWELLFALPAAVTGYVDLTDGKSFGLYPYIGDTQND